jgi:hypothetical protein
MLNQTGLTNSVLSPVTGHTRYHDPERVSHEQSSYKLLMSEMFTLKNCDKYAFRTVYHTVNAKQKESDNQNVP